MAARKSLRHVTDLKHFPVVAVKDHVEDILGQILEGHVEREAVLCGKRAHHHRNGSGFHTEPDIVDGALINTLVPILDDEVHIRLVAEAQAVTGGASAEGAVERKEPRGDFLDGDVTIRAGILGVIEGLLAIHVGGNEAARHLEGDFQAIRQTAFQPFFDLQTIHDHRNGVLEFFIQRGEFVLGGIIHAVDDKAQVTELFVAFDLATVFAFASAHHRREDAHLSALTRRHHAVGDLVNGSFLDLPAAIGAMRYADAGVQKTQKVVDLCGGAHGGTGVPRGGFLVDGNGGRKPVDIIHVRLIRLPDKLAGVGRKALHVAALPFRKDSVEGERRLAAPRQAGKHRELVFGDLDVDVFEVVLPRSFYVKFVVHISFLSSLNSAR